MKSQMNHIIQLSQIFMNITTKKKEFQRSINGEQAYQNSRAYSNPYQFEDNKKQSISYRLSINYNQIIQLLKERKDLLQIKSENMMKENYERLSFLKTARSQDLKNEAKLLKDQTLVNLIESSQKAIGQKNLIQKVSIQDIGMLEVNERNKLKRDLERLKQQQVQILSNNRKYQVLKAQIQKFSEKQRNEYREIEKLQQRIIEVLSKKQKDHLKKAEDFNNQIQDIKKILRKNKNQKDQKKKQLTNLIRSLLQSTKMFQQISQSHHQKIKQLYNGIDGLSNLQQFFKNFQLAVKSKIEPQPENAFQQIVKKILKDYQLIIQELGKFKEDQNRLFKEMQHNNKSNIRNEILGKAYLNGISSDKKYLIDLVGKCKQYQRLMASLEQQNAKISRQVSKNIQMYKQFSKKLKSYQNQQNRRIELRKELERILTELDELEKYEKKNRNYEFETSNLQLQKRNLQTELDQYASKGMIAQYKAKDKSLNQLNKEIQRHKNYSGGNIISQLQNKLLADAKLIYQKYPDIIKQIIKQQGSMSYSVFLTKLSKRLNMI